MAQLRESDKNPPVIMNESLQGTEVERTLSQQFKVRVSSSTQADTCIFPKSGITFLVVPLADSLTVRPSRTQPELSVTAIQSLEKLVSVHRHCYAICVATFHGPPELEALACIQQRFLSSALQLIPAHGLVEAAQSMTTLAKAIHCNPGNDSPLQTQLYGSLSQHASPERITKAIQDSLRITDRDITILVDHLGTLQRLATASLEELADCPLSRDTIHKVHNFFHSKP